MSQLDTVNIGMMFKYNSIDSTSQHHQHQHQQQQTFGPVLSPMLPMPPPTSLGSLMMYDATPVQSTLSHFANTDQFYLAAVQASSSSSSPSRRGV
jgi:hypothetical protein